MIDRCNFIYYFIFFLATVLLSACLNDQPSPSRSVENESIKPYVTDTYPTTNQTTAATTEIISITFSEAIAPVNTSNVRIAAINSQTGQVETALSFPDSVFELSAQDKVLSVKLANSNVILEEKTRYLVQIKGIKDYVGNVMDASCEFVFATTGASLTNALLGPCKSQPGVFGFGAAVTTVAENVPGGSVEIIVKRINGSDGRVSVDYQTRSVLSSVSAVADRDYSASSGTLIFEDGDISESIIVTILDDVEIEGDESFKLNLISTINGVALADTSSTAVFVTNTVTITDDEITSSNVLSFSGRTRDIRENITTGKVTLTVFRPVATDAVSVDYSTVDGTSKAGLDYIVNQGTLNFAVGEKNKFIDVSIINDKKSEPQKSFKVVLSNAIGTRLNSNYASFEIIINDDDTVTTPGNAQLSVTASLKILHFSWTPVNPDATYNLVELPNASYINKFKMITEGITGNQLLLEIPVHLQFLPNKGYRIQTCINSSCVDSNIVKITDSLTETIGYFKAVNTGQDDSYGTAVALSDDGLTLAVGAPLEDSDLYGVVLPGSVPTRNSDNNNASDSGAVYLYSRAGVTGDWQATAYIKASNIQAGDQFGHSISLSGDGLTLAVAAKFEDSGFTGTNNTPTPTTDNNAAIDAGAVYVFTRVSTTANWTQQAYLKASNTGAGDNFGHAIALSNNGDYLIVGAHHEDSSSQAVIIVAADFPLPPANEINTFNSGAVYVFSRRAGTVWSQQAYLKAANAGAQDFFGHAVALSGNASTIVVGAYGEDGINNSTPDSGAVYIFTQGGLGNWAQQQKLNSSKLRSAVVFPANDYFGWSVAINDDAKVIAVGAKNEDIVTTSGRVETGRVYIFDVINNWRQTNFYSPTYGTLADAFGDVVALSGDGNILIVGKTGDDSNIRGINFSNRKTKNKLATNSGSVIVLKSLLGYSNLASSYSRSLQGRAVIKASNTNYNDKFGSAIALSFDGDSLAVGATGEASSFAGVKNNNSISNVDSSEDNSLVGAGAVFLY